MRFAYIPPSRTLADAEAWALSMGVQLGALERGPDGLIRGTYSPRIDYAREFICRVAAACGVSVALLLGPRRNQIYMPARYACYWGLRQMGLSFPEIARQMGRANHVTVLKGLRRVRLSHKKIAARALRERQTS